MAKVEISTRACHNDRTTEGVVGADDVVASGYQKVQAHHQDVDGDDDGGHSGGPEHGLGSKRLQDAEASLAGDDGGQDLGNPGEPVETQQVVVCHKRHNGAVSNPRSTTKGKERERECITAMMTD